MGSAGLLEPARRRLLVPAADGEQQRRGAQQGGLTLGYRLSKDYNFQKHTGVFDGKLFKCGCDAKGFDKGADCWNLEKNGIGKCGEKDFGKGYECKK